MWKLWSPGPWKVAFFGNSHCRCHWLRWRHASGSLIQHGVLIRRPRRTENATGRWRQRLEPWQTREYPGLQIGARKWERLRTNCAHRSQKEPALLTPPFLASRLWDSKFVNCFKPSSLLYFVNDTSRTNIRRKQTYWETTNGSSPSQHPTSSQITGIHYLPHF